MAKWPKNTQLARTVRVLKSSDSGRATESSTITKIAAPPPKEKQRE